MPLAHPRHHRLVRLGDVVHLERRILVVQTVQTRLELLLVVARGGVHGEGDDRLRKVNLREPNGVLLRGERVVRVRVLELGDAADVARVELLHLDAVASLPHREMPELLHDVARGVVHLLPVHHHPRQDAEEGDVTHVRLRLRLEDEGAEGSVVLGVDLDGVVAFGAGERVELLHLVRRRHELDDLGEERSRAEGLLGGDAEEREELALLHPFLHRGDGGVARDLVPLEVRLEERIVGGGDRLDQVLIVAIEVRLLLGRDVRLLVLSRLRSLPVQVRLAREEIEDAAEVRALADRHLDGNDLARQALLDLLVDALEGGVLLVHQGDDEQHRIPPVDRLAEHLLRSHLDAAGGTDDDERAIGRGEPRDGVALEVEISRRVDQVDLRVHPLGVGAPEIDRVAALRLLGSEVGERGAVLHRAVTFAGPGNESERVDQSGLPARSVTDDRHVADLRAAVLPHGRHPRLVRWPLPSRLICASASGQVMSGAPSRVKRSGADVRLAILSQEIGGGKDGGTPRRQPLTPHRESALGYWSCPSRGASPRSCRSSSSATSSSFTGRGGAMARGGFRLLLTQTNTTASTSRGVG